MNMENKTDRELLELAAKSVGISWFEDCAMWVGNCRTGWNPLEDDGDRYRLAKRLKINIDFLNKIVCVFDEDDDVISESWANELDEARAIVRLAARIGESK